MKRLSYLLASTVSALAALVTSGAMAQTTAPEPRDRQDVAHETTHSAGAIVVSQAARRQIDAQARPAMPEPTPESGSSKDGPPKSTKGKKPKHPSAGVIFVESADPFQQSGFPQGPDGFNQSPGFSEFFKQQKQKEKSKPGQDVKESFAKKKKATKK